MSHESEHSLEEDEESKLRSRSPDHHGDSMLERMLASMEKVSTGQHNLDKRLNDRLTDVTAGQNDLRRRLTDVTVGQNNLDKRLTDMAEGQQSADRRVTDRLTELSRDQKHLLNRIEVLEAEIHENPEVSTRTNPNVLEPPPKVAELPSAAALPLDTFVNPTKEETAGFEPEPLVLRRSARLKDRPQPDYRFPTKTGLTEETGARPKEYPLTSGIQPPKISLRNVTSPLLKPPVVARSRGGDGDRHTRTHFDPYYAYFAFFVRV